MKDGMRFQSDNPPIEKEYRILLSYYGKPETYIMSAISIEQVKRTIKNDMPDHKLLSIKTIGKKKMNFYNKELGKLA